jgi:hypothetical protein
MRITLLLLASILPLTGCFFRVHEHEREHRRGLGDFCYDHDDCERGLVCDHSRGDHDRDDGVCLAPTTPPTSTPTPNPCVSTASVYPGGSQPCTPEADGGPVAGDGGAPIQ